MANFVRVVTCFSAVLAINLSKASAGRLKDCGDFGCYEEELSEQPRFLADWFEFADEHWIRGSSWENETMKDLREKVSFNLYASKDRFEASYIDSKWLFELFRKRVPTKIVIHGWQNYKDSEIGQSIKDAYFDAKEKANIIVVDWSEGSMRFYTRAKAIVYLVAEIVAEFIDRLVKENGMDMNSLHIIGHSLGAHVAGLAGAQVKAGKPARVTGLDPARPNFSSAGPDEKISKASAKFVDIIHSCSNRLGLSEPLGHVDYYPNRGEALQRGCLTDYTGACSHSRSFQIYAESVIKPKGFKATLCSDWKTFTTGACNKNPVLYIGEETPKKYKEGSYFLKTAKDRPLALGEQSNIFTPEDIKEDEEDSVLAKMLFKVM